MTRKRHPEEEKIQELKKLKVIEHHGLLNQGATCYLNSVLQVLFMSPEIHRRFDGPSHSIDQELSSLFNALERAPCKTQSITDSLDIKNVFEQRDAAECLERILKRVNSKVSEVFQGKLTEIIKCSEGHIVNEEMSPFWTLPLSLKTKQGTPYSVEIGFQKTFQRKLLQGDNRVYCSECKEKTEATSRYEMLDYPQILVLLLKRFEFDYETMSDVKSERCVDVPLVLNTEKEMYTLYGMVSHKGSLRGGHYTATILSKEDETWYEFDDAYVEKVKEQPFANNKSYKSTAAYLLMYRRVVSPLRHQSQRSNSSAAAEGQRSKKEEGQSCSHWLGSSDIKKSCVWIVPSILVVFLIVILAIIFTSI